MKKLPTVYRRNDASCYLFDNAHKGVEVNAEYLFDLAKKGRIPRLWILTDTSLINKRWRSTDTCYNWFIVFAAALPDAQVSSEWEASRGVTTYYMQNWSWSEIFTAFRS